DQTHGATYTTGSVASNANTPIRIAQSASQSTDIAAASSSNVLDIEPMAASPSFAAPFVQARTKVSNGIVILYSDTSDWPAVKANVAPLPANLQSRVRYWVASLGAAQVTAGAWGTQYAWQTNYDNDITTQAGWAEILSSPPTGGGTTTTGTGTCTTT